MHRPILRFIAPAAILIVAGVAYLRVNGQTYAQPKPDARNADAARHANLLPPNHAPLREHIAASLVRLNLPAESMDGLSAAAVRSLEAYGTSDPANFMAWLEEQKLTVPSSLSAGDAAKRWSIMQRGLAGATLDFAHCSAIYTVRAGQAIPPTTTGKVATMSMQSSRSDRGAGDVDAVAAHSDTIELIFPGTFIRDTGEVFDARFSVAFTRRLSDGRWIVTGTAFRDVPLGKGDAVMPPPV